MTRSNWQPHARFIRRRYLECSGIESNTGWTAWSYLLGGVDLHRFSGVQHLFVNYTGGGVFTVGGQASNGVYQALNLADQFKLQRFTLTFLEQFSYSPERFAGSRRV